MFGIGITEIIIILVVALLVVGPKKLPELAKTLGRGLAEFRRTADEFKESIYQDDVDDDSTQKKAEQHKTTKILYPVAPPDSGVEAVNQNSDVGGEPDADSAAASANPKIDKFNEPQKEDISV